ncbi:HAMP domain-containing protein [bacterium]|nr:HAMP domain-containing protein [bacterium]
MKFSLRLKLGIGIILVASFVFGAISFFVLRHEQEILETSFAKQGVILTQALDSSIGSEGDLVNKAYLQNTIYKLMWLNPDVYKININVIADNGLQIAASNDTSSIGASPPPENQIVLKTGQNLVRKVKKSGEEFLTVISPIHLGGRIVGTYEIGLTLASLKELQKDVLYRLFLIFGLGIVGLVLVLTLVLQITIIRPINLLQKGTKAFGSGDLGYRIKKVSNDEFGDLAESFNSMAQGLQINYQRLQQLYQEVQELNRSLEKKVRQRTWELEQAKKSLEKKVKERTKSLEKLKNQLEEEVEKRTKELQERIKELERIQKVTTGRELKMIELKKRIKELEQKLKKKGS